MNLFFIHFLKIGWYNIDYLCDADFNIINNEKYFLIIKCIKYEKWRQAFFKFFLAWSSFLLVFQD